jgi:hypothetical protein
VPTRLALGKDFPFFKILCRVPPGMALGKVFYFFVENSLPSAGF